MKVLFISSGNSRNGISPIIKNQGESLKAKGIELDYFTIKGKGIMGYLNNIPRLRKFLAANHFDIVHAHYSLSAFTASLSGAKPLVVSLMGSDVHAGTFYKFVIKLFETIFWSKTIVKSKSMYDQISIKKAEIIPNGVEFNRFKPLSKFESQESLGWDINKKHVLFAAIPIQVVKNFELAGKAFDLLNLKHVELHYLNDVSNEQMPIYHNASDLILLTSLWEGSPNVIKEAMACNIPIVATDVGDVKEIIAKTEGCYVATFEAHDIAEKIQLALDFGNRTTGRNDIGHLESGIIAKKIIDLYNSVLRQ